MKKIIIISQISLILLLGYFVYPIQSMTVYWLLFLIQVCILIFTQYIQTIENYSKIFRKLSYSLLIGIVLETMAIIFINMPESSLARTSPYLNFFLSFFSSYVLASVAILIPIIIGDILANKKKQEIAKTQNELEQEIYKKESSDWDEREAIIVAETKEKLAKDLNWLQEKADEYFLKYRGKM